MKNSYIYHIGDEFVKRKNGARIVLVSKLTEKGVTQNWWSLLYNGNPSSNSEYFLAKHCTKVETDTDGGTSTVEPTEYKVGDKVRLKPYDSCDRHWGINKPRWNMLVGITHTISNVMKYRDELSKCWVHGQPYTFLCEFFELADDLEVTTFGDAVLKRADEAVVGPEMTDNEVKERISKLAGEWINKYMDKGIGTSTAYDVGDKVDVLTMEKLIEAKKMMDSNTLIGHRPTAIIFDDVHKKCMDVHRYRYGDSIFEKHLKDSFLPSNFFKPEHLNTQQENTMNFKFESYTTTKINGMDASTLKDDEIIQVMEHLSNEITRRESLKVASKTNTAKIKELTGILTSIVEYLDARTEAEAAK